MTPAAPTSNQPSPADLSAALADVVVEVRRDLEITRQLHAGQPQYIIRDSVSFQSRSLSAEDYRVFASLDGNRTCAENFRCLVADGILNESQAEEYYGYLLALHQRGLLHLPISDGQRLYQRFQKRQAALRKGRWMQLLCYKLPLWNPDAWLSHQLGWLRIPFCRPFVAVWLLALLAAVTLVATRWNEFVSPLASVMAMQNLPLLLVLLCLLKAWHELGHAAACKTWGANVPEVGVLLIVGTPCAYVDASAAWGIPSKFRRIMVTMAGIYFESLVAILAVAVWIFSQSPSVCSVAHHIILLSTLTTLIFNANPLMRFDGYFALSDILEIPNLRQRAGNATAAFFKKVFLGLDRRVQARNNVGAWAFVLFGIASSLYRVTVIVGIVMLLALRLPVVGLVAGAIYAACGLSLGLYRLIRYLLAAEETRSVATRARMLVVVGGCLVLSVIWVPLPTPTWVNGIIAQQNETLVRAPQSGFIDALFVLDGQRVDELQPLLRLRDETLDRAAAQAETQLEVTRVHYRGVDRRNVQEHAQRRSELIIADAQARQALVEQTRLTLCAAQAGKIVQCSLQREQGRRVQAGEPLLRIASGGWQLRCVATQDQLRLIAPKAGEQVEISFPWDQHARYRGSVEAVASCGSQVIRDLELTHVGGGSIPVNPMEQRAEQPYFLLTVALHDMPDSALRHATRATVHFQPRYASLVEIGTIRWLSFYREFLQQDL